MERTIKYFFFNYICTGRTVVDFYFENKFLYMYTCEARMWKFALKFVPTSKSTFLIFLTDSVMSCVVLFVPSLDSIPNSTFTFL